MKYEAARGPRFLVEHDGEGETIRIRAQRPLFVLLFLAVWLTGWTVGGVGAIAVFLTSFEPFIGLWLCGWLLGWLAASLTVGWMLAGSETLRVVRGDLEHGYRIGPWSRRKLYQGSLVRGLRASSQTWPMTGLGLGLPFGPFAGRSGALWFSYGGRSVRAASGLDETEGQLIVERLLKRLPPAAGAA